MARYFFHIDGESPYRDEIGVELADDRAAWREAKQLARDIEDHLSPGRHWHLLVCEGETPVYRVAVTTECWRPKI